MYTNSANRVAVTAVIKRMTYMRMKLLYNDQQHAPNICREPWARLGSTYGPKSHVTVSSHFGARVYSVFSLMDCRVYVPYSMSVTFELCQL